MLDALAECGFMRLLYGNEGSLMLLGVLLAGFGIYKAKFMD